ncbi:MAG TPA: NADP-dependent oxidoreductase [Intrasporangium sp.]|uniref:NADP-dependent oxidoreductase n=1 Tax=Intrasporangium sp. TaxID=1925024 RepID=UPI002B46715D|nr:NADP-dependent oxidoreductase [Intrasporangium sp.]HKX66075.1 NADP-dependent oxidoreductase [Intrasporangium sp.]
MRIFGFERYGGPEVQRFFEVPTPERRDGTVLVAMRAAGVNPADIKVRTGQRQGRVPVDFPMAMGREASGVVVSADDGSGLRPGRLVFGSCAAGSGALAELVLLDAKQTVAVPEGVTAAEAACIPVAIGTAWDALDELDLHAGDTLLVVGAGGGVGSHAVQLGRLRALRVIGVASPGKRQLVLDLGAVHVASGPGWTGGVRAVAPEGVHGLIDTVGGEILRESSSVLRPAAAIRSTASPALAADLGGSGVTRRRTAETYDELARLVAAGKLAPVVGGSYDFEDCAEAVALVEAGHATGRTVVTNAR